MSATDGATTERPAAARYAIDVLRGPLRALAGACLLACAGHALAQGAWTTYHDPATNRTIYVQPATSDPSFDRRVAWIASPVSIGDLALKWAFLTAGRQGKTELLCQTWEFDGVRDGSLVFTLTRLATTVGNADAATQAALQELDRAGHGSEAWARALGAAACHPSERPDAALPRRSFTERTLYVPLGSGGRARLRRPWARGFLALRFDYATNILTIAQS